MSFDLKIINGDLSISNGKLKTVEDSEKLIQDILKICLTPAGSNPNYPWYGSFLSKTLIGSTLDEDVIVNYGQSQIQKSLEMLQQLQDLQIKNQQAVSADEQLAAILSTVIYRNPKEPRLFNVMIKALSRGTKPITTAFSLSTI